MRDNFSTHPQAPRSYILVLASMLIFNTGPVFAQQTVHAQTTVKFDNATDSAHPLFPAKARSSQEAPEGS